MKYYKVCYVLEGKYFSAIIKKDLCKEYFIDKWTYADKDLLKIGFGLLCFNNLRSAIMFNNDSINKIFECETGKEIKQDYRCGRYFHWDLNKSTILDVLTHPCLSWPRDTIMTDKIKLIKEVKV